MDGPTDAVIPNNTVTSSSSTLEDCLTPRNPSTLTKAQEVAGIQDIMSCIFYHLLFQVDDNSTVRWKARNCLFQAALSSKTMCKPALSALWHTIPSISICLPLLPFVTFRNNEYKFVSSSAKRQWARFDYYATKVRAVILEEDISNRPQKISKTLFCYIDNVRQQPLFPGLKILHLPPEATFASSSIFSIVSPSLQVLRIATKSKPDFSVAILHLVLSMCPNLSELTILDGDSAVILPPIAEMQLRKLHLNVPQVDLPYSFISSQLDRSCTLTDLKISARGVTKGKRMPSWIEDRPKPLCNLASLELRGDMASALSCISFRAHNLTKVELDLNSCKGLEGLSSASLTILTIHSSAHVPEGGNSFDLTKFTAVNGILPPYPFLERIDFAPGTSVLNMTDSVMELLGASLPNLKTVIFPINVDDGVYPTTDGLMSICTLCCNLETLHLPVQSISTPSSSTTKRSGSLKHLSIYTIHDSGPPLLSSTIRLARMFYRCFPGLETVDTYGSCFENTTETCRSIQELLYFMRDIST